MKILNKYKTCLIDQELICASVSDANSMHRQAAVQMGILPKSISFDKTDIRHGHMRVHSPEAFRKTLELAGIKILEFGGYWLK